MRIIAPDSPDTVVIRETALSVDEAVKAVLAPNAGGIATFIGTTRDHHAGKEVVRLEYEAFDALAKKELARLVTEAHSKWPVHAIAVYHRIGVVPVMESSVIVAVSSEHRREAIAACAWLIDELKASVPIWKKEVYADGTTSWKQNCECTFGAAAAVPGGTAAAGGAAAGHAHDHDHGHGHSHGGLAGGGAGPSSTASAAAGGPDSHTGAAPNTAAPPATSGSAAADTTSKPASDKPHLSVFDAVISA